VLPNFLPLICPFVLPLAIITGILICYSRLSKDNEIMAAYAGGIHPIWLILPAILTSIIAIFITLTLNEVASYSAIRNIERLVVEDQANILTRMLTRPGNITVPTGDEYLAMSKLDSHRDPNGRSALDITRFAYSGGGDIWDPDHPFPTKRISARDHSIQDMSDEGRQDLILKMTIIKPVFQDLHAGDINKTFIADGESGEERIILNNRPNVTINSNRSSFWSILMLSQTRREAEAHIAEIDASMDRILAMPDNQREQLLNRRYRYDRIVTTRTAEINMRLALCFSCFSFAILGIPLGMRSRGTIATSFAIGLAASGFFFLLLKFMELSVGKGLFPFWTIWLPNILVVILGLEFWRRGSIIR
jgi:lipopolysaccharide export LptBFGC system permease protein LptF